MIAPVLSGARLPAGEVVGSSGVLAEAFDPAVLDLTSAPTWTQNHYWVSAAPNEYNSGAPSYSGVSDSVSKQWRRDSTYANWTTPLSKPVTGPFEFEIDAMFSDVDAGVAEGNGYQQIGLASTDDWWIGVAVTMDGDAGATGSVAAIRLHVIPDITPGATSAYASGTTSGFTAAVEWLENPPRTFRLVVVGTSVQLRDGDTGVLLCSLTATVSLSAKTWDRFGYLGLRGTGTAGDTGHNDNRTTTTVSRVEQVETDSSLTAVDGGTPSTQGADSVDGGSPSVQGSDTINGGTP